MLYYICSLKVVFMKTNKIFACSVLSAMLISNSWSASLEEKIDHIRNNLNSYSNIARVVYNLEMQAAQRDHQVDKRVRIFSQEIRELSDEIRRGNLDEQFIREVDIVLDSMLHRIKRLNPGSDEAMYIANEISFLRQ